MTKSVSHIRLTRAVIKEMFEECNRLYFNNTIELPVGFQVWTPHAKTVGMVRPVKSGKRIKSILHISKRYRWSEENLRKVVVHEMIHLAIGDYKEPLTFIQRLPLIGRFFITEHDNRFISLMNELNDKHGLGITVRAKYMKQEFIR